MMFVEEVAKKKADTRVDPNRARYLKKEAASKKLAEVLASLHWI
jgi:hypothetical protein